MRATESNKDAIITGGQGLEDGLPYLLRGLLPLEVQSTCGRFGVEEETEMESRYFRPICKV